MSETPRADFWFSIVLSVLGLGIVAESLRMPRLEHLGVHPMSAPGLTPGVLGLVLAVLGFALLFRSIRATPKTTGENTAAAGGWSRLATTLALCLAYALVLLGWLPFWLATALFVFAFVLLFTWSDRPGLRSAVIAGSLALVVSAAVTLLFQEVFLVRLP